MNLFKNILQHNYLLNDHFKLFQVIEMIMANYKKFNWLNKYYSPSETINFFGFPSVILGNNKFWYKYNNLHRDDDLPAIMTTYSQQWFKNGQLHRENDLPAVINTDGSKEWHYYSKYHRNLDQYGKLKPAIIDPIDGDKYYYNGVEYDENWNKI